RLAAVGVVVDHQYPEPVQRRRTWNRGRGLAVRHRLRGCSTDRQAHEERGAFAFAVALRVRRAAVQLDDAADDREPDAEAALRARDRGVGLPELLEDVRQE